MTETAQHPDDTVTAAAAETAPDAHQPPWRQPTSPTSTTG